MLEEQTRYSRLANITKIINTKLELREVLQHVTKAISEEIVRCNSVGIYLRQPDGSYGGFAGKPEFINGVTIDTQVIDLEFDLLAKEVSETRKTIYIPDTSADNRPDPRSVAAFQIKSLLALPIALEQELFGMVFLFDYGTPMNLTESEIQSVEAYVNMAAVAIQNSQNLAQKEKLLQEKQLMLNAASDLTACSSLKDCIDKTFYYLAKSLSSQDMAIHLLDSAEKQLNEASAVYKTSQWTDLSWNKEVDDMCNGNYDAMIQHVMESKTPCYYPEMGAKWLLMYPLISMGNALGVVTIVNAPQHMQGFGNSHIQEAQAIVEASAPTFSNLMHLDQLESMVVERTKELASANEKLTSVIDGIPDGFMAFNKEWEFIFVNSHQYLPDGKTPNEVLGKNFWTEFPQAVHTPMYKHFHRAMDERVPVHFELLSTTKEFWHEVVAYPYDDGICCLFKNITDKKNYENELGRLSKLEMIGQMAAGISHEIRNPMTTVRGFLQLLTHEEDFKKHTKYFDLMIDELDRANSIITEFLSMGNTRTSELQMQDLNAILHEIAQLIKIDTFRQGKQIQIVTEDLPHLLLNRDEIRQLIINLSRNGLEAMEEGKALSIGTYMEDDNCVVLAVKDQGKGISPDILEKLGTPFYTTKDTGTGLGLGICYAIAARHNAKIEIETGPDGTTFYTKFTLSNKAGM